MNKKKTDSKARLERAIAYWIKYRPIATDAEIQRVAKKFGVTKNDVKTFIRELAELEGKQ